MSKAYLYTGPDKQPMIIEADEVASIERSGRSTWQEYAATPAAYPDSGRPWDAMDARPGQTAEATRVEQVECDRWKPLEMHNLGSIHCNHQRGTLCSDNQIKGSLSKVDFLGALTNARVCHECAEKYKTNLSAGRNWTPMDDAILAKWWKYTTMRHRVANVLNRSLRACKQRYDERHR